MEKKNFVVIAIVAMLATVAFTGCSKEKPNKVAAAAPKHTIRVVIPEELKDKVQFELHIQPHATAITTNEAASVATTPESQNKEPEVQKESKADAATTPAEPAKKVEQTVTTTKEEPGWFDRKWKAAKDWWNA